MSVVAVIVGPNGVLMAGDGVSTDSAGNVAGYVSKIIPMPEMKAVIGVTGMGGFGLLLQWNFPHWVKCFDDLIEALPACVRGVTHYMVSNDLGGTDQVCVVVAGWSDERQAYEAWRIVNYAKEAVIDAQGTKRTLTPYELYPIPQGLWASTGTDQDVLRECGVIDGPDCSDQEMLVRMVFAARIIGAGTVNEGGVQINVGGFVQLAQVNRDYVVTWMPHRWLEDVPGKPVNADLGMRVPDFGAIKLL